MWFEGIEGILFTQIPENNIVLNIILSLKIIEFHQAFNRITREETFIIENTIFSPVSVKTLPCRKRTYYLKKCFSELNDAIFILLSQQTLLKYCACQCIYFKGFESSMILK